MTKIKTSELTGPALDWAVAKIEAPDLTAEAFRLFRDEHGNGLGAYCWSINWSLGGPIIEREKITIAWEPQQGWCSCCNPDDGLILANGPTPLIAAMRCFCAAKLGDEVDVPEELA
jgi:hypothetical protein